MDRGTPALIGWLGLLSLLLIAVVTTLVAVFAPDDTAERMGWPEIAWMSLLRTLDPGTMGGDTGSAIFLGLMLTVTLGGIFIVSSLIGVLTTGLENQIAQLRKGRSPIVERGHAVILGWSDQVFVVISELAKANQASRRSCVAVLADLDKVHMEDQIRSRVRDLGKLRVICRSGSPLKPADLELMALDAARSIMIISPPSDNPDIDVVKTLLLLRHRPWPVARPAIVAAIQDTHNMPGARLAAGGHPRLIDADDIAVRIVVQSHRQSGLSTVCTDLLDFSGNEIYIRPEPRLTGSSFGELMHAYELGRPIGIRRADGSVTVNPPPDTVLGSADQIVLIAEDDLLIKLADEPPAFDEAVIVSEIDRKPAPDRTVLIGWNSRGTRIVELLDRLVEPGSTLDVAALTEPSHVTGQHTNLRVEFKRCDPTNRQALETLNLGGYQHVIVLADESVEPDRADDITLITLLHLRDIEVALGDPFSIVTEMNADANRMVAQITKADDFIVSTKLISLLMTQLAENVHLQGVFADLFDPSGSEIYLKPAAEYVAVDVDLPFAAVVEAARRRGETAIGYRLRDRRDEPPGYGVVLNPVPAKPLKLGRQDSVIVIARD
jgi:voltage-gated potassium channel Kch